MNLKPFQYRVVREKSDLDQRICRLRNFLSSEQAATVSDAELARLKEQEDLMDKLSGVLGRRIEAFGEPARPFRPYKRSDYATIHEELAAATSVADPASYPGAQAYLNDVVRVVNTMSNDQWDGLSNDAQDWFNCAADALRKRRPFPLPQGYPPNAPGAAAAAAKTPEVGGPGPDGLAESIDAGSRA